MVDILDEPTLTFLLAGFPQKGMGMKMDPSIPKYPKDAEEI